MRIYMFEHCSLCFRVRMIAALKRLHLQETVVLDDDTNTMVELVGKRVIPILVKDDGQPMLESMDMVKYIDGHGVLSWLAQNALKSSRGLNKLYQRPRRLRCRAIRCSAFLSSSRSPRSSTIICASVKCSVISSSFGQIRDAT